MIKTNRGNYDFKQMAFSINVSEDAHHLPTFININNVFVYKPHHTSEISNL